MNQVLNSRFEMRIGKTFAPSFKSRTPGLLRKHQPIWMMED
jgi:hypothetical protein